MKLYLNIVLVLFVTLLASSCARINADSKADIENKSPLFNKNVFQDLPDDDFNEDTNEYSDEEENKDPLRPINYAVYKYINENAIVYVFYPLQVGYKYITPEIIQRGTTNAFNNLDSFLSIPNYIFVLELEYAGLKLGNFLVNGLTCAWLCDNFPEDDHLYNIDLANVFKHYEINGGIFHVLPLSEPANTRDLAANLATTQGLTTLTSGPVVIAYKLFRSITQDDFSKYLDETDTFSLNDEVKYDLLFNAVMNNTN